MTNKINLIWVKMDSNNPNLRALKVAKVIFRSKNKFILENILVYKPNK